MNMISQIVVDDDFTIMEQHRTAAAVHQAKLELRLRARGSHYEADRAHNRMVDTIEASRVPHALLDVVVRALGRNRALNVGIERPVVDTAMAWSRG
jgi:hypothetical protein